MGWLMYVGVRAQKVGSSLSSVFTLGEPPGLHPWLQVQQLLGNLGPVITCSLQDSEARLPKRASAAIACASKSLKENEGCAGVSRILKSLVEGSAVVDHSPVEVLVEKLLEQHGGDEDIAGLLWKASQSGRLAFPQSILVGILEAHKSLLAGLVETFLVEGLQSFETNLSVSPPATLVSVIATSRKLYTQTLNILQTHLVQSKFDPRLLQLFQVLTEAILASSPSVPKLFPPRLRALVILLQAFDAFDTAGQGGEIAEEILNLLAIKDVGSDEELWDSGGSRLLATENNHWNWSLEKRLLLLQFPQVLPHLPSLTHQTHH